MAYLNDAWYCAGFADELGAADAEAAPRIRSLTMLGQPVLLYRLASGAPVALVDRCPHRFAPLSMGKIVEDRVQCPYHGLEFNAQGACTVNPHGDRSVPKAAQVRALPVLERHGALWVWMGNPAAADPALLPDFSDINARPGWSRVQGCLHVQGNYQLISDNLLDLSHVPFLHPFLASKVPPPANFEPRIGLDQQGNTVTATNLFRNMPISALYQMLWQHGEPPANVEMRAHMRWNPPANLLLDTGACVVDGPRDSGPSVPSAHWLTPETETSTHYFWVATRDRFVEDAQMSERVRNGIGGAFRMEDEPMVEAVQRNMGSADLWSLKPVLLATDGPAVRARRTLDGLIKAQD